MGGNLNKLGATSSSHTNVRLREITLLISRDVLPDKSYSKKKKKECMSIER